MFLGLRITITHSPSISIISPSLTSRYSHLPCDVAQTSEKAAVTPLLSFGLIVTPTAGFNAPTATETGLFANIASVSIPWLSLGVTDAAISPPPLWVTVTR